MIQKQIILNKTSNPTTINEIVNLSNIAPKDCFYTFFGIVYTPTYLDTVKWLEWYNENQNNFYFDKNHDVFNNIDEPGLYYLSEIEKSKVVFVRNDRGDVKCSLVFLLTKSKSVNKKI